MNNYFEQITEASKYIQSQIGLVPDLAIILGSGLGDLANDIDVVKEFSYSDIPHFPISTVPGHAGKLILGTLMGKKVVVMKGRMHFYEGYPMSSVIFPVRVMHALGAKKLIVTNAAGGLNPKFSPGDVMLITDHINMQGDNALIGPNDDSIGPRFPDMTNLYTPELRKLTLDIAEEQGITLQKGVYVAWSGPTYETPAERRFLRQIGGDAVGMSTVPEATAARHAGMEILGFSAITNIATGGEDQPADDHEHVLAMAKVAGEKLVKLVRTVIQMMPQD